MAAEQRIVDALMAETASWRTAEDVLRQLEVDYRNDPIVAKELGDAADRCARQARVWARLAARVDRTGETGEG